ncbi:MAG: hypothetical protein Q9209_007794 [Squamulea sp. 1 TL-2023]
MPTSSTSTDRTIVGGLPPPPGHIPNFDNTGNSHYAGVHQWDVPLVEVGAFIKRQYFGELAYYLAAFFTKTSILSFIARVFRPHRRAVLFARVLMILMVLYYLPAIFIRILRCKPIRKTWNPIVGGACFGSEKDILYVDCVVSLVSDIAIFGLPR